ARRDHSGAVFTASHRGARLAPRGARAALRGRPLLPRFSPRAGPAVRRRAIRRADARAVVLRRAGLLRHCPGGRNTASSTRRARRAPFLTRTAHAVNVRRPMMRSRPLRTVVAAIDMGYGHLRAAAPLAVALGVPLV